MKYTVTWFRYPHEIEGKAMDSKSREFDSFEKVLAFAIIKSVNWARVTIEDENSNMVYDITDGYVHCDYRKKSVFTDNESVSETESVPD